MPDLLRVASLSGRTIGLVLTGTAVLWAFGCGNEPPDAAGEGGSAGLAGDDHGGSSGAGRGGSGFAVSGGAHAGGEGGGPAGGRSDGGQAPGGPNDGGQAPAGSAGDAGGPAGRAGAAGADADGGEAGRGDSVGFEPVNGLDPGGRARRIGDAFYTAAQALLSAGDGSSWLLWRSYSNPDFAGEGVYLDRFDGDGRKVGSSALAALNPDGIALHDDGSLTAVRNHCGVSGSDTCFYRDHLAGPIRETVWPEPERTVTQYLLDQNGNIVGSDEATFGDLNVMSVTGAGLGLHAVVWHGSQVLYGVDEQHALSGGREILPRVIPPELPIDAPIDELLHNAELARQSPTDAVVVADGVVVAATVMRGTLAALFEAHGVTLPLPDDPRCPDVVVALFDDPEGPARYFGIPTQECESLPRLTAVAGHAVVASVISVAKDAEPNDTHQYDIGLGIVNLATGTVVSRSIAFEEDDIVYGLAPCGSESVCIAGLTGAKSVDTGSTVSFGKGFVVPVTLAGELGQRWTLASQRHSEILKLVPANDGLLFYATVNGPITHTADADPWLGFNEGMLGAIEGWP